MEGGQILDLQAAYGRVYHGSSPLLETMLHVIEAGDAALDVIGQLLQARHATVCFSAAEAKLLAPVPVPPQMREGQEWFQGTADAVYQNLALIEANDPDVVAVFGADHVYRMDLQQMIDFHLDCDADVTVAALPVPLAQATAFGVIDCDASGRIREFVEKPPAPPAMPTDPARVRRSGLSVKTGAVSVSPYPS